MTNEGGAYCVDSELAGLDHQLGASTGLCKCGGEGEEVYWGG